MILRMLFWLLGFAIVAAAAAVLYVNHAPDPEAMLATDPAQAERTGRPNDFLVAPEGATAAPPDLIAETRPGTPAELVQRFAEIALSSPRVREISPGGGDFRVFKQSSALIGYPDYISVKAVSVTGGAALIVYSRSRFGYSDLGVNKARIEDWLSRL